VHHWLIEADRLAGRTVDRAVVGHHTRRLRAIGWGRALAPPDEGLWPEGDPPPRPGNSVRVLVDGSRAMPAIAQAIREARQSVTIAGWSITPSFRLVRDDPDAALRGNPDATLHGDPGGDQGVVLHDLLADTAERIPVRVVLWAGAPLPLFRPWRRDVRTAVRELGHGSAIRCAIDRHERPLHSHHEKIVLVDEEIAFVGGIDITDFRGDRFDAPAHPPREGVGWHDVAIELRGPVVGDVAAYLRMRWAQVTHEWLPRPVAPPPAGDITAQFVATIPERIYSTVPRGSFRILEAYVRALRSAQHLIYLENQFLWAPEIVAILKDKLAQPPGDDFRMVVLLPARPNSGGDDTLGQLAVLAEADAGRGHFLACSLYSHGAGVSHPVYIHAKVGIVDDAWLTVGSCNLNDHSLFNDTEANIVVCDAQLARDTRLALWAEHLEMDESALSGDAHLIVDRYWRPIAAEQEARRKAGQAPTHRLVRLPHVSKRSERLLGPLQGFVVDG
jgi:phosphatidylserine/phosphatidylglycerophosphate/cardiolipin synthase-like enzyme